MTSVLAFPLHGHTPAATTITTTTAASLAPFSRVMEPITTASVTVRSET